MRAIDKILKIAIEAKASDVHLINNVNPVIRVDGELVRLTDFSVNDIDSLRSFILELLNDEELKEYETNKYYDSSFQYENSRFRLHIYREMRCDAVSLRLIPTVIPTFAEMNLPQVLRKFSTIENGLVLVAGVTGSGKSTTLAAIIDEINKHYSKHIITVENPVEFIHRHNKSIINQREVGTDVLSFSDAVSSAMREDPDIILLGELRDLDTIANAITMAETGHLVFGTLHTRSVADTVDRLIDVFPANQQEQIRVQLSNSLQGIICQKLVPKIGGGRVPCCEIMFQSDAIRSLIRDHSSPNVINDAIFSSSRKTGAQTNVQALAKLVVSKLITKDFASKGLDESDLELLNKMIVTIQSK